MKTDLITVNMSDVIESAESKVRGHSLEAVEKLPCSSDLQNAVSAKLGPVAEGSEAESSLKEC